MMEFIDLEKCETVGYWVESDLDEGDSIVILSHKEIAALIEVIGQTRISNINNKSIKPIATALRELRLTLDSIKKGD